MCARSECIVIKSLLWTELHIEKYWSVFVIGMCWNHVPALNCQSKSIDLWVRQECVVIKSLLWIANRKVWICGCDRNVLQSRHCSVLVLFKSIEAVLLCPFHNNLSVDSSKVDRGSALVLCHNNLSVDSSSHSILDSSSNFCVYSLSHSLYLHPPTSVCIIPPNLVCIHVSDLRANDSATSVCIAPPNSLCIHFSDLSANDSATWMCIASSNLVCIHPPSSVCIAPPILVGMHPPTAVCIPSPTLGASILRLQRVFSLPF